LRPAYQKLLAAHGQIRCRVDLLELADAARQGGLCLTLQARPWIDVPLNGLLANRVVDGLDGAVARATVATVRGAFLDIVLDFAFYAAFPHDYCLWLAGRSAGRSRLYAWAEGHDERLAVLAEELVRLNPDIIVTTGTPGTLAAKRATSNTPIVLASSGILITAG